MANTDQIPFKPLSELIAEGNAERPLGPAERLRTVIKARGFPSVAEFARAIGINDNRILQQLKRNSLSKNDAPRYAEFLRVNLPWLLEGRGMIEPPDMTLDPATGSGGFVHHAITAAYELNRGRANPDDRRGDLVAGSPPYNPPYPRPVAPAALVGERDLPVYGAAMGGEGALQVDPNPIEWVKRPAPLMGVAKAFAVYVVGDSMSPAYEQGDMILVHPSRPIERGLDALLVNVPETGEWRAIVKRVEGWTEKVWRLAQFNPKRSFDVPRADYPQAFKIVGKYNRR
ncbi:MAG: hypothetical protein NBV67_00280 [Tagaea sp.]|nr:hypothetical protein [Tagaea sp.]